MVIESTFDEGLTECWVFCTFCLTHPRKTPPSQKSQTGTATCLVTVLVSQRASAHSNSDFFAAR